MKPKSHPQPAVEDPEAKAVTLAEAASTSKPGTERKSRDRDKKAEPADRQDLSPYKVLPHIPSDKPVSGIYRVRMYLVWLVCMYMGLSVCICTTVFTVQCCTLQYKLILYCTILCCAGVVPFHLLARELRCLHLALSLPVVLFNLGCGVHFADF